MHRCILALVLAVVGSCSFQPSAEGVKVSFAFDRSAADEGNSVAGTQVDVRLTLDRAPGKQITVSFEVNQGESVTAADFDIEGGANEVVFGPEDLTASILVNIKNDRDEEQDEVIELRLLSGDGADLGELTTHIITISANVLPRLQFAAETSSADEAGATQTIMVMLDKASPVDVVVDFVLVAGGSATPVADHGLQDGTVTIPANMTSAAISVAIVDDELDEFNETFAIQVSTRAGAVVDVDAIDTHTHTIVDEDDEPTVEFEDISSPTVETGTANIDVTLSAVSGKQITVSFAIAAGTTATGGGTDFTLANGTLTFLAGAQTAQIQVPINPDTIDEPTELVVLEISNPVNATIAQNEIHSLQINDDDNQPQVRFDPAQGDRDIVEDDGGTDTFNYPVLLSSASGRLITVNVAVGGNAEPDDFDIGQDDIPVTFQPGETTKNIRVIVNGDGIQEPNDDVRLTLTSATNATLASDNQARQHRINNDD